jgi:hypothetical protein
VAIPQVSHAPSRDDNWRSLQFFHEKTKPSLVVFNSAAEAFWTVVLPQMSDLDGALKSQLIATASAHELSMAREHEPRVAELLISAYTKALKLVAYNKNPQFETVLTSCLLSIAMESVQGHFAAAYKHLRCGFKILREWQAISPTVRRDPDHIIERYLSPIYEQLAATFGLQFRKAEAKSCLEDVQWSVTNPPGAFKSLREARERLAEIGAHMNILSQKHDDHGDYETGVFLECRQAWLQWTNAFHALRQELTDPCEVGQWRIMELFSGTHKIAFHSYCSPDEMRWDYFTNFIRRKVDLCEEVGNETRFFESADGILMDPGPVPPLWQMAIGCRDPTIRRRAIRLIHEHHRKCGHEDSCFIALHAQAIMDIEEEGLSNIQTSSDIPESRRIRPVAAEFNIPGVMRMTYTRSPYVLRETRDVSLPDAHIPTGIVFRMWPNSQIMRLSGYQLLIRPEARGCRCKSFGRDDDWSNVLSDI